MKPRPSIAVVACVCFAAILGLWWAGAQATRKAQSSLARLSQRRVLLDRGVKRLEEEIAADNRDKDRIRVALEDQGARRAAANRASRRQKIALVLTANPRLFALYLSAYRADLGLRFGPLYKKLGLSSAQIEKFERLMAGHEDATMNLESIASSYGMKDSDPAIATMRREEDERLDAAQAVLLGDPGYAQFRQLERVQAIWPLVEDLAVRVAFTPTPLSESQGGQLVQLIANSTNQYQSGGTIDADATIDWEEVLSQARGILPEPALAVLRMHAESSRLNQLENQFYQEQAEEK